jgi:hypothetical protein
VQIVKGTEEMLQASLEQGLGEPARWISPQQVLPAIPHGPLNQALVAASGTIDGEHLKGGPHMPVSRMRRVRLVDGLVSLILISACLPVISNEYLQGDEVVISVFHISPLYLRHKS